MPSYIPIGDINPIRRKAPPRLIYLLVLCIYRKRWGIRPLSRAKYAISAPPGVDSASSPRQVPRGDIVRAQLGEGGDTPPMRTDGDTSGTVRPVGDIDPLMPLLDSMADHLSDDVWPGELREEPDTHLEQLDAIWPWWAIYMRMAS